MQSRLLTTAQSTGAAQSNGAATATPLPLPPGWHKAFDDTHKQFYYYHDDSRDSQWEVPEWPAGTAPTIPATSPAPAPAPAGEGGAAAAAAPAAAPAATNQSSLDDMLPQHAARASQLEVAAAAAAVASTEETVTTFAMPPGPSEAPGALSVPVAAAGAFPDPATAAGAFSAFGTAAGVQTTLDALLPHHAARAAELEGAFALDQEHVQPTFDSSLPQHAAHAQDLQSYE